MDKHWIGMLETHINSGGEHGSFTLGPYDNPYPENPSQQWNWSWMPESRKTNQPMRPEESQTTKGIETITKRIEGAAR